MPDFDLTQLRYLARVTAREVGDTQPQTPLLALYAPGLPCADPDAHRDVAARLHFAFLARPYNRWGFLGPVCYTAWHPGATLTAWETALGHRHLLVGTGLPLTWRSTTQRDYWKLVPALALLWQVEPHKDFLRGYLQRLTTAKQALTEKQERTMVAMLRERGARGYSQRDWPEELAAHTRVLRHRRDLAFRLGRLAALDLAAEDAQLVQHLQAQNTAWERGRLRELSEREARTIAALEAQYVEQRLEAAEALAKRLAREIWRNT